MWCMELTDVRGLTRKDGKMAVCKVCKREMKTADGCGVVKIHIGGKVYDRIKCGDGRDFAPNMKEGERCFDCGAKAGYFHHWGCDAERCPACGGQLGSCDCEDVFLKSDETEE